MTTDQKKLWDIIDRILWEDWDPVGISGRGPRDEYHRYVPQLVKMVVNKSSAQEISMRLYKFETIDMGLEETSHVKDHCDVVARKLIDEASRA